MRKLITCLAACILLNGCAFQRGGRVRSIVTPADATVATDAQMRVITNAEIGSASVPGNVDPLRITCSEPSPDVATTVANSLSASLSILGRGTGSLSNSSVSSLAQLVERTATIQLLRDKMYQTCLAFANGGMTRTTYSLVMAELDEAIVSMLMSENASGAFGRSLSGLGTEISGESTADLFGLNAAASELAELTDSLRGAVSDVTRAEAELAEKKAAIANKEMPTKEELEAVKEAETKVAKVRSERDELLKKLQSRSNTLAKTTGKATVMPGSGINRTPDPAIAKVLAEMHDRYLSNDFTDSFVSACLIELGANSKPQSYNSNPGTGSSNPGTVSSSPGIGGTNPGTERNESQSRGVADSSDATSGKSQRMVEKRVGSSGSARASWLAELCQQQLEGVMASGREHQLALAKVRSEERRSAMQTQAAMAQESADKARADRIRLAMQAVDKCKTLEDQASRKVCVERLIEPPGNATLAGSR